MTVLGLLLMLAALLCSLVAGFLFAFAVVVMPGINRLEDAEFVRAFQAIDGVIQRNQPVFIFVWAGEVRWNRWNMIRTLASIVVSVVLLGLLFHI